MLLLECSITKVEQLQSQYYWDQAVRRSKSIPQTSCRALVFRLSAQQCHWAGALRSARTLISSWAVPTQSKQTMHILACVDVLCCCGARNLRETWSFHTPTAVPVGRQQDSQHSACSFEPQACCCCCSSNRLSGAHAHPLQGSNLQPAPGSQTLLGKHRSDPTETGCQSGVSGILVLR